MMRTNARQLSARHLRRARQLDVDQQAANTAIADMMTRASVENLAVDIYNIPVKTSPTGRRLWVRTGRLFAAERWVVQGRSVVHVNTAPHAVHRYRYGRPGGRPARPPQGIWRGPRFVLGSHLREIQKIRLRHFRHSLRVR